MTISQQARVDGFRLQAEVRGHSLRLNGDGDAVLALVEIASREQGQFLIQREVANASKVHVLRSDLDDADLEPGVGDIWHDEASGGRYRVSGIEDQPVNVLIVYECETVTA